MSRTRPQWIGELVDLLRVTPGSSVTLAKDFDSSFTAHFVEKKDGPDLLAESVQLLSAYQDRLAAQDTDAVLLCLQALDAAAEGRHDPSRDERREPARCARRAASRCPRPRSSATTTCGGTPTGCPLRGEIAIFNRSHYEEVLVVRVHPRLLERQRLPSGAKGQEIWKRRFAEINDWEHYLSDNGIHVLKVFLNISKEEQRLRFLRRLDLPDHNWKFSASDVRERRYWDDYQRAFSDMLSHTSTEWAPWHVIPADHKWFARICVGAILVQTLQDLDPRYPEVTEEQRHEESEARAALIAEAPPGAAPHPFGA